MDPIKNTLDKLVEKRPGFMWHIIRLIFITSVVNICVYGFSAFLIIIYPFAAMLLGMGAVWCLLWFLLPTPIFIVFILLEFAKMIYYEYIDV